MFWRNENTNTLGTYALNSIQLMKAIQAVRDPQQAKIAEVVTAVENELLEQGRPWIMQDFYWDAERFSLSAVFENQQKPAAGDAMAGGVHLTLVLDGGMYTGEISSYLHRLICTNGMIRKVERCQIICALEAQECRKQIAAMLPFALETLPSQIENISKAALIRIGLLRPLVPVTLDYLGITEPRRGLILDAFNRENGDTLWHFINAFTRAANSVMLEAGIDEKEALRMRIQLQKGSVTLFEELIGAFENQRNFLEVFPKVRQAFAG